MIPTGRTKTAPAETASLQPLSASPLPPARTTKRATTPRIAGWRRKIFDLVVHLGDYILRGTIDRRDQSAPDSSVW